MEVREEIVREIRENVMSVRGIPKKRHLLGFCHENAFELRERLRERGFDADVCLGAFETPRIDDIPDSASKASELGIIHFWVISNGTHVDMASEPDASIHAGDCPDRYEMYRIVHPDSPDDLLPSNIGY